MPAVDQTRLEPAKQAALDHFLTIDQKLGVLARRHLPGIDLPAPAAIASRPAVLMRSIVGQQISIRAADSIWRRLQPSLVSDDGQIANPGLETLLAAGASTAKAQSLLALGRALRSGRLDLAGLDGLSDRRVTDRLVQYPGIGLWTAEMFLIRGLGRADVFSLRDLGLRTALARLHRLPPGSDRLEPLAASYSPYGTAAALVCWRSLDSGDL